MELIKITPPIAEYLNEYILLSEDRCKTLLEAVENSLLNPADKEMQFLISELRFIKKRSNIKNFMEAGLISAADNLEQIIKNKYKFDHKKLESDIKKMNDAYTKLADKVNNENKAKEKYKSIYVRPCLFYDLIVKDSRDLEHDYNFASVYHPSTFQMILKVLYKIFNPFNGALHNIKKAQKAGALPSSEINKFNASVKFETIDAENFQYYHPFIRTLESSQENIKTVVNIYKSKIFELNNIFQTIDEANGFLIKSINVYKDEYKKLSPTDETYYNKQYMLAREETNKRFNKIAQIIIAIAKFNFECIPAVSKIIQIYTEEFKKFTKMIS